MNRHHPILHIAFMLLSFSAFAQQGGGLPDSISTSIDSVAPPPRSSLSASSPSSDSETTIPSGQDKQDSTSRNTTDTAVFRTISDSVIDHYKNEPDFAYANDPAYWTVEKEQTTYEPGSRPGWFARFLMSRVWKYIVYAGLLALLVFGLYRVVSENGMYLFYRRSRGIPKDMGGEEDEFNEPDLDQRVQEALRSGDFRLATRFLFIMTLRLMDAQNLIRFQAKATNEDYIRQLVLGAYQSVDRFRFLAGVYEKVWYGGFDLSEPQYARLDQYFQEFYKSIIG